jgi:hypothetical protein
MKKFNLGGRARLYSSHFDHPPRVSALWCEEGSTAIPLKCHLIPASLYAFAVGYNYSDWWKGSWQPLKEIVEAIWIARDSVLEIKYLRKFGGTGGVSNLWSGKPGIGIILQSLHEQLRRTASKWI